MTVLQVLPALETGGVERGTVEMVQAVVACGGRALVASAGGRMVTQVERAGGRHLALSLMTKDPVNILFNAGRLARIIRANGIDLVHARSRAPGWSAWMAARRTGVPFVTTWHGVYGEEFPGKHAYNSVMARGQRVIAISHYIARRVASGYAVPRERLRIIPRGVDSGLFHPGQIVGERMHRLAQAWRLPAGARIVMLPARLTRWKGAETLLDALATIGPAHRDVVCVLVGADQGRGHFARALEARAGRLGLAGRLRMTGHCDDMAAALMLADIVVNASLKPEPFGRSVIEAQAMGRPTVAFDHGGAAETIRHGLTGYLVTPGDATALGSTIGQLLDMPDDKRASLGERARASVMEGYTTASMQEATLEVYREVLAGGVV